MLVFDSVQKRFTERTALDGISFTVPEGTVFGLLGSNGAGKTTAMRLIMGILLPDGGGVTWRGQPIGGRVRERFGYLPEERGLYPKMKVRDQLVYLARLRRMKKAEAGRAVDGWLERLGLGEHRDRRVEQLSKGNQQKVQFIAAVAHDPDLVVMDEPFSGLDPENAALLRDAVGQLRREGKTILLSTHRMDQAQDLCERIAFLHRSRLAASGPLREVREAAGRRVMRLDFEGDASFLGPFAGVEVRAERAGSMELALPAAIDPQEILRAALSAGRVTRFEVGPPSLEEVYFTLTGSERR